MIDHDPDVVTAREMRLKRIEKFLHDYGISATRFGIDIMNDTSLMTRLRAGGGIHADTLLKIDGYIERVKRERQRVNRPRRRD